MSLSRSDISTLLKSIYSSLESHPEFPNTKGCDSEGEELESIVALWEEMGVVWNFPEGTSSDTTIKQPNHANDAWYTRAADYYEEYCPETLEGVLGGFANITDIDLNGSKRFVDHVVNQHILPKKGNKVSMDKESNSIWMEGAGCECGAGIGRVTKGLLLQLPITRCDLVESSRRLLSAAPVFIGDPGASRCRYICESLQTWVPMKKTYSIIWIQWVLVYLTDADIIQFLSNCGEALTTNGVLFLKENVCEKEMFVLDREDASVTRSLPYLHKLIEAAGLVIIAQEMQNDFPEEIFPVPMIALQKNEYHVANI
jgi:protein N-terminal methyltransferase